MSWLTRLEKYFEHDLWARDLEALHGFERVGTRMLRLGAAAVWSFQDRVLSTRATGLVYTTLLSLVPFLAVTFSVLKAFGAHLHIEPLLAQALLPLGPKGEEITSQVIGFVTNMKV
ncbi:MAG: ribonuclease BN, partial [Nitrospiraceae bacterium]